MKIELADVLNFFEYEKVRDERRRRVIEIKRARRVTVGRYLVFLFENRETILFQINAAHTEGDIAQVLAALRELK